MSGTTRGDILMAFKARLELDAGLGVGYIAGGNAVLAALSPSAKRQSAPVSSASALSAPVPAAPPPGEARPASVRPAREEPAVVATLVPFRPPASNPEKEAFLAPFREQAMECRDCGLCEQRRSVVWGEGSLDARVMFIGEGPGRDEDEQGRPFVGRSGRLLTDIIEKGMKTARNEVYIANVVKCRPPGNRDPRPDEVAACSRHLGRQLEAIRPRVIVAVGNVAGRALLGLAPGASGMRGRWHEWNGAPLRVIYHPSFLLRQRRSAADRTRADRETWADIQEVLRRLEQAP